MFYNKWKGFIMSISVNAISPTNNIISNKEARKKEKHVDTKTVAAASLAIAGITTMAILALRSKKKPKIKPDGKKPDVKPEAKKPEAKKPDNAKKPDDVKKPEEAPKTKEPEKIEKPKNIFNKKVADMTEEEKLAFIKEVQAQTDDPVAKAQYAEYIQNGTWDLLN